MESLGAGACAGDPRANHVRVKLDLGGGEGKGAPAPTSGRSPDGYKYNYPRSRSASLGGFPAPTRVPQAVPLSPGGRRVLARRPVPSAGQGWACPTRDTESVAAPPGRCAPRGVRGCRRGICPRPEVSGGWGPGSPAAHPPRASPVGCHCNW